MHSFCLFTFQFLISNKQSFMSNQLQDKVVYITGGSKGIGYGIAQVLLETGMKVAITSRHLKAAQEAARSLSEDESRILPLESDVSSLKSETDAVKAVTDHFGKL